MFLRGHQHPVKLATGTDDRMTVIYSDWAVTAETATILSPGKMYPLINGIT